MRKHKIRDAKMNYRKEEYSVETNTDRQENSSECGSKCSFQDIHKSASDQIEHCRYDNNSSSNHVNEIIGSEERISLNIRDSGFHIGQEKTIENQEYNYDYQITEESLSETSNENDELLSSKPMKEYSMDRSKVTDDNSHQPTEIKENKDFQSSDRNDKGIDKSSKSKTVREQSSKLNEKEPKMNINSNLKSTETRKEFRSVNLPESSISNLKNEDISSEQEPKEYQSNRKLDLSNEVDGNPYLYRSPYVSRTLFKNWMGPNEFMKTKEISKTTEFKISNSNCRKEERKSKLNDSNQQTENVKTIKLSKSIDYQPTYNLNEKQLSRNINQDKLNKNYSNKDSYNINDKLNRSSTVYNQDGSSYEYQSDSEFITDKSTLTYPSEISNVIEMNREDERKKMYKPNLFGKIYPEDQYDLVKSYTQEILYKNYQNPKEFQPQFSYSQYRSSNDKISNNRILDSSTTRELDAVLGLLKLKRIYRDGTYQEQGYKYKTNLQTNVLNDILQITPYPNAQTRDTIAVLLNLNPRTVQIWFQNARQGNDKQMTREQIRKHKSDIVLDVRMLVKIYIKNCSRL